VRDADLPAFELGIPIYLIDSADTASCGGTFQAELSERRRLAEAGAKRDPQQRRKLSGVHIAKIGPARGPLARDGDLAHGATRSYRSSHVPKALCIEAWARCSGLHGGLETSNTRAAPNIG
jgi:hypothetical protein